LEGKTWTSPESVVEIVYQAQAVFRVRAVTRCTSSIEGHAEAILTLQFSPNGRWVILTALLALGFSVTLHLVSYLSALLN